MQSLANKTLTTPASNSPTERALRMLAGPLAQLTGTEFCQAVCRHVADDLRLDYVYTALLEPTSKSVRIHAGWGQGAPMELFAYPLAGTPCANVIAQQYAIHPKRVQHHFPDDPLLAEMGLEAYVGAPLRDRDGRPLGILVALSTTALEGDHPVGQLLPLLVESLSAEIQRSRTEAKLRLQEDLLRRTEASYRALFDSLHETIYVQETDGRFITVNKGAERMYGHPREWFVGRSPVDIAAPQGNDLAELQKRYARVLAGEAQTFEFWGQRADGTAFPKEVHARRGHWHDREVIFALAIDITDRKAHQQQLEYAARYDSLTGLPNRSQFAERVRQSIEQAHQRGRRVAIAYIDLDGFKAINDRYGHDVGDRLLVEVARRMERSLRGDDIITRLGGDEFAAILSGPSEEAITPLLNPLLNAADEPLQIDHLQLRVSASIGVAFCPLSGGADPDQLLRQADQAMYQAKLAGKNRYHLFDAAQDRDIRIHHENIGRIREALEQHEFVLYYQPKVNMHTGEVVGVEALIRWQHPERGLLTPLTFLPDVEGHSLDVEIGEWVIASALYQSRQWQEQGHWLPISVNISAWHMEQDDFVERLQVQLASHPHLPEGSLELEVLESTALEDINRITAVMRACTQLGVGFALDDFGTGYASLTYLKRLPAQVLKIDQSFIRDMLEDPDDLAILEGVLGLAGAFRRKTIAEGVETLLHGELLLQLGCELAQGYGIAHPMPAEALPNWLASWQPDPLWRATQPLSHDDLPILYAGVEHRAWINAVEASLHGLEDSPPPLDHHQCRFGNWLDHHLHELEARRHHSMAEIQQLHQQVHAEAIALLRQAPLHSEAAQLRTLHQLRDNLLEALAALLHQTAGKTP